ncbi:Cathepsin L [Holothuria leucospilota]|uniref:Cathepsin L n=1 Tax=Holothuria leucospilota TaxID=206669 RepID=A0A9Q1H7Y5_HOLLE|nr:Cathepsin L [Holothuria leucospilota]
MITHKLALIISCVATVLSSSAIDKDLDHSWKLWKQEFSKNFSKDEEMFRRRIWEDNLQLVNKHNDEHSRGLHSYTLGMNEYADMTNEEFVAVMTGYTDDVQYERKRQNISGLYGTPPRRIDWRDHGYVTKVKTQGHCGSCWAFTTTGALEGQHFRKTGQLVSLSEQNLVDCSTWNDGCRGGLTTKAFQYVIDNGGIDTEWSYQYEGQQHRCRFNRYNVGATMTSYVTLRPGSEPDLERAVGSVGPIATSIDAEQPTFRFYKSGIYYDRNCNSLYTNHAVLVVGYDTDPNGVEYWIVKNSWGAYWGQGGYAWMLKYRGNQCGIANYASYPIV